jgi:hypothetical protein
MVDPGMLGRGLDYCGVTVENSTRSDCVLTVDAQSDVTFINSTIEMCFPLAVWICPPSFAL